jgi:hypothetical protein
MMSLSRLCLPVLTLLTLVLNGCASSPEVDTVIKESSQGSVYLERIPDRSFQAAHPLKLNQDTVARVLSGIQVKEDQGLLRSLARGQSALVPAFSAEEVRFLSPLMTDALTKAASDQQVGFRLVQFGSGFSQKTGGGVGSSEVSDVLPVKEMTRGALYAYGRSLYVTLTEYRARSEPPDTVNMPTRRLPDSTGLTNRTLSFAPESAKRPDSFRGKQATDSTLVIDYELLASLPQTTPTISVPTRAEAQASPSNQPPPGTEKQLRALEDEMRHKNVELEELRKELQDIRRQLDTQPSNQVTPPSTKKSVPDAR